MALAITHPSVTKKFAPSKLVVGILVAAMTAFVGLAGVAGATSDKPTKEWCEQQGFKNYGQCVREWAHDKGNGHSGGYGGYGSQNNDVDADVNTDVDLTINGNNNAVTIIINYIFGSNS